MKRNSRWTGFMPGSGAWLGGLVIALVLAGVLGQPRRTLAAEPIIIPDGWGIRLTVVTWGITYDLDGDGYKSKTSLDWIMVDEYPVPYVGFAKVYIRPDDGKSTWTLILTTAPVSLSRDIVMPGVQSLPITGREHGKYDFRIEVYQQGHALPDDVCDTNTTPALHDVLLEKSEEDPLVTLNRVWVDTKADRDHDGYFSSIRLHWDPDVKFGVNPANIEEKVYMRPAAGDWRVLTTLSQRAISGVTTQDARSVDITGQTHGQYDFRVEVNQIGVSTPDAVGAPETYTDLKNVSLERDADDRLAAADRAWTLYS